MAAAAAIAGLIRCVRPPCPCRPSKLRFDVEAQRSPALSLSSFMATHIEQPASLHSKPAALNMRSRPSASAWMRTLAEPGTTIADTVFVMVRPAAIFSRQPQVLDATIGTGADEDAIDGDVFEPDTWCKSHIAETALHPLATFRYRLPPWDQGWSP